MITCDQKELKQALGLVMQAVPTKATLPVLTAFLLTPERATGRVRLQATNLEIGMTTWIDALITDETAMCIPARMLSDVITNSPAGAVTLTTDPATCKTHIQVGRSQSSLYGFSPDEYPPVPVYDPDETPHIQAGVGIFRAIAQTVVAAAKDDSRPTLAAVNLKRTEDHPETLVLAAADGFRLGRVYVDVLPSPRDSGSMNINIPATSLKAVLSGVQADDTLTIALVQDGNQMVLATPRYQVVSRLIDGAFPDYNRIIPTQCETTVTLARAELTRAAKVAQFFASQSVVKLTITADPPEITLSANAGEVGDNTCVLTARVTGIDNVIAVNVGFLLEALGVLYSEQVTLSLVNQKNPLTVLPDVTDSSQYVHIIMPMQIR